MEGRHPCGIKRFSAAALGAVLLGLAAVAACPAG
jgi:hypothetical protein